MLPVARIERGFAFLGYWITQRGVTGVAPSTWEAFRERVARLYGQNAPQEEVQRRIGQYVLEVERCCPDKQIAVLIPELVQRRWYHHLLHNKRASVLKALLLLKGNQRIIVINVPWYLSSI